MSCDREFLDQNRAQIESGENGDRRARVYNLNFQTQEALLIARVAFKECVKGAREIRAVKQSKSERALAVTAESISSG